MDLRWRSTVTSTTTTTDLRVLRRDAGKVERERQEREREIRSHENVFGWTSGQLESESREREREIDAITNVFGMTRFVAERESQLRRAETAVCGPFGWSPATASAELAIRASECLVKDTFGWSQATRTKVLLEMGREMTSRTNCFGWDERMVMNELQERAREIHLPTHVFGWTPKVVDKVQKVMKEEINFRADDEEEESLSPFGWSAATCAKVLTEMEKELPPETLALGHFPGAEARAENARKEADRRRQIDEGCVFGWTKAKHAKERLTRQLEIIQYDDPQRRTLEEIRRTGR